MGKIKGTTKSQGKKHELDKFYTTTTTDIALYCINLIEDISQYDIIIEPSAGNGSFSNNINNCIAYDISPEYEGIIKQDWFTVDKTQYSDHKVLVIGNPPFGTNGNVALSFIKESDFADGIAFILPKSFKKESMKNRIPLNFSLVLEQDLPINSFTVNGHNYNVPCVFQYWVKSDIPRTIIKDDIKSDIIEFVNKEQADFRIQRVGGNAGKASLDIDKSISSNYFVKNISKIDTDILIKGINNHIFPRINDTVGPRSLSKRELIKELKNILNEITQTILQ